MKCQLLAAALCALCAAPAGHAQPPQHAAAAPAVTGHWEGEAETDRWPLFLLIEVEEAEEGLGGRLRVLGQNVPLSRVETDGRALTVTAGSGANPVTLSGTIEDGAFVGRLRQGPADFPFRLRRVKAYPRPASRIEAWEQDLEALEQRFLPADRSFSPAERALFLEALAAVRRDLPRLADAEITARIAAAVALADNAHTRLYLLRNRQELSRLPVRLWWFSDGLYVVRAAAPQAALAGCRVDAIGNRTARNARDLVAPLFAGTPGWTDYKSVYSLTSPETLHGAGVTRDADSAELTVSGCPAAGKHRLLPLPLVKSREAVEAWWDLSPRFRAPGEGWRHALDGSEEKLPPYLLSPDNYSYRHLPESGILYFQYNRSAEAEEESTKEFGERLLAELARRKPRAFVLDLRFNTGGNLTLAEKLMAELVERTEGMPRFVITGRATFSAGLTAAAPWRKAGVTFVGEPVGDVLNFWSEGGNIRLPNSGYDAHFANGHHHYSPGPCPAGIPCLDLNVDSLDPHILATPDWEAYRSGRDPAMEAILAMLRDGRSR